MNWGFLNKVNFMYNPNNFRQSRFQVCADHSTVHWTVLHLQFVMEKDTFSNGMQTISNSFERHLNTSILCHEMNWVNEWNTYLIALPISCFKTVKEKWNISIATTREYLVFEWACQCLTVPLNLGKLQSFRVNIRIFEKSPLNK